MPRGRFISKVISLDEKVNSLPNDTARLLFTWLISHLDCEGRLHGDALTVKSIVFPRRSISTRKVEQYLNAIEKNGLIVRYSVNGNTYLFAPHFEKHQVGLQKSKEAQSQIPPPTPELLQSNSIITPPQVKAKAKVKVEDIYIKEYFNTFWEAYPKKRSKGKAEVVFKKVNPSEELLGIMLTAIDKAMKSNGWQEYKGKYIPYPATWLNAKGWEDEIEDKGVQGGTHRESNSKGYTDEELRKGSGVGEYGDRVV